MSYLHVHEESVPWTRPRDAVHRALRTKLLLDGTPGRSDAFVFGLAELPPGASLPLHAHGHCELDYVLSGRARIRLGADSFTLETQGTMLIPPNVPHAIEPLGDEPFRYAYTYASELRGNAVETRAVDADDREAAAPRRKSWMQWDEAEDWFGIEEIKGMRVRVRRLTDHDGPAHELLAGIGEIDPRTHYTLHYHDQPEIYYIVGGEGVVFVAGDEVPVRRGSTLYIGGGVVHGADSLGKEPLGIYYVYGTESVGHDVNWTPVEEVYDVPRTG